jgi:hypothetical protein
VFAPPYGGLFESWVEAWSAAGRGITDCVQAGARTAPWPLDVGRWLTVAGDRKAPSWSTPHEVVFEAPLGRLRDFSSSSRRSGVVPTLVLPPQAGHDSCIVDYSPEQSQMRTIVASGLTRAYTLDWRGATRDGLCGPAPREDQHADDRRRAD